MRQFTKEIIPPDRDAVRIDRYLAQKYSYNSRSLWQREIMNGNVTVNGMVISAYSKKIKGNDVIEWIGPEFIEPEVSRDYSILHEDDFLIAVNKPANLPVHPSGIFYKNTLLALLEERCKVPLFPIHRLDRETSGIVLFGKDKKVSSLIQNNFDTVRKIYFAIVKGEVEWERLAVDVPIGTALGSKIPKKRQAYPGAGERACTNFERVELLKNYTVIRALPETGRLHQIRVHLNYAGHPILGDKLYGADEDLYLEFSKNGITEELSGKLEFPRCALHAASIRFMHYGTGKELAIEADMPDDMKDFITREKGYEKGCLDGSLPVL